MVRPGRGRVRASRAPLAVAGVLGLSLLAAGSARADLVPGFNVDETGTGLGNVSTILSIDAKDDTGRNAANPFSVADASITRSGGADVITTDAHTDTPGGANNQTRLLAPLGINGSNLVLVYNIKEPGSADGQVEIQSLDLLFYDANDVLVHTASLSTPYTANMVGQGTGVAGVGFTLDATQAAIVNAISGARVGLSTRVSGEEGGFDTFYIAKANGSQPPSGVVPEPGALAMLLPGLAPLGLMLRRRRSPRA